jgi:hypothetical protein
VKLLAGAAAVGLLAILLAAFLALRNYGPAAFPSSSFADRALAEAAGAFDNRFDNWLPKQIPPGATALRESHNPSTHQTWGSFRLPAPEAAPGASRADHAAPPRWIPAGTARIQPGELMLLGAPKNVDWWPQFLRGRASSAALEAQGLHFFVVEQGEPSPLVFGIRGDEVWFWRLARQ